MESDTAAVSRRRKGALLVAGLLATAGGAGWHIYDSLMLAAVVAAGGLIWTSRQWKAWLIAVPMATGGLVWSGLDTKGCSVGSKARVFYEKLVGHLPYVEWSALSREAFSPSCFSSPRDTPELEAGIKNLENKTVDGHKWELYQTSLGNFWIPAPGKGLLNWLLWEITVQHVYESGKVTLHPGDTVIDCGAHIGVFTRYALSRGASRVVAIEPEPTNTAILEANFLKEIAEGRVKLVKAGVWNERAYLTLSDSEDNSARHTFVADLEHSKKLPGMPVLPLDEIVGQLGLDRVDFIKMDIEGAERRALKGARQTLERFKPRMAICTYHLHDDGAVIPAVVKKAEPGYRTHATHFETGWDRYVTKVMYFEQPPDKSAALAPASARYRH